ncbi:hypothetical protein ACO0QE_004236 [Hanseniaspora vineae]
MYHSSPKKKIDIASRVLAEKNVNESIVAQSRLKAEHAHIITKQKARKRTLYVKKPPTYDVTKKVNIAPSHVPSMPLLISSDKINIHSTLFRSTISKTPSKRTLKNTNNSFVLNGVSLQTKAKNNSNESFKLVSQHLQDKHGNSFSTNDTPLTEKLHAHNLNLNSNLKLVVNPLTAQNIAHLQYAIKQTEAKLTGDCGHAMCHSFYAFLQNPSADATGFSAEWELRCQMFHDMDLFADQESLLKGNIRQTCYLNFVYTKVTSMFRTSVDLNSSSWPVMKTIADCTDEFPFPAEFMIVPEIDEQFLNVETGQGENNENEDEIIVHITSFDDCAEGRYQGFAGRKSRFIQKPNLKTSNSLFPKKSDYYSLFSSRKNSLSRRKNLIDESSKRLNLKENLANRPEPCLLLKRLNKNAFNNIHDK